MATGIEKAAATEPLARDRRPASRLKRQKGHGCGAFSASAEMQQASKCLHPASWGRAVSSEKTDMKLPERDAANNRPLARQQAKERDMQGFQADPAIQHVEFAAPVADLASRRVARQSPSDPPLRCVSSGYLSDGCSCTATIPAGVVADAWAHQKRAGVHGDRFFHFTWRSAVWLAYGLKNGRIGGVYCPQHSAERDLRSLSNGPGQEGARRSIALAG